MEGEWRDVRDLPDIDARIEQYAAAKQEHVIKLIGEGRFMAFPDADGKA